MLAATMSHVLRTLVLLTALLLFLDVGTPREAPLPGDADGCFRVGAAALDQGNHEAALFAFAAAESRLPQEQGRHLASHLRAHCLQALGREAEAAALLPDRLDTFVQEACFGPGAPRPGDLARALADTVAGAPPPADEWRADPMSPYRMLLVWDVMDEGCLQSFEIVADLLAVRAGERIADVGCGVGPLLIALDRVAPPDVALTGVDLHPGLLAVVESLPLGRKVQTVRSELLDVSLPTGSQDRCVLVNVYHCLGVGAEFTSAEHVQGRIQPLLRSLRRALRPGGRLDVVDFLPRAEVVREHCQAAGFRLTRALTREPRLGDDHYLLEFTR